MTKEEQIEFEPTLAKISEKDVQKLYKMPIAAQYHVTYKFVLPTEYIELELTVKSRGICTDINASATIFFSCKFHSCCIGHECINVLPDIFKTKLLSDATDIFLRV